MSEFLNLAASGSVKLGKSCQTWYSLAKEYDDMTIHLPPEIESSIQAAVHSGHFASVDAALAEAWRVFQRHRQPPASGQGLIGALRDDAELLDQIVEHAMKVREERPWRLAPDE
jgi:Arc/MetJ-type ribon-helix-helix transcriptional regulator